MNNANDITYIDRLPEIVESIPYLRKRSFLHICSLFFGENSTASIFDSTLSRECVEIMPEYKDAIKAVSIGAACLLEFLELERASIQKLLDTQIGKQEPSDE